MQCTRQQPETHHSPLSHRVWVTIHIPHWVGYAGPMVSNIQKMENEENILSGTDDSYPEGWNLKLIPLCQREVNKIITWKAVTRKVMIQLPTTAVEVIIKSWASDAKIEASILDTNRKWRMLSCKDFLHLNKICASDKHKKYEIF